MKIFKRYKILAYFIALPVIAVSLIGAWALHIQISDNLHVVHEGELYRSAQLSPKNLENAIRQHGIETVINLRGTNLDEKWYRDEVSVTGKLNVRHIDFKLSASKVPTAKTIARLNEILEHAPRPILIHCQGGADRSGLVAALYQHGIAGRPVEEAEDQLSFYYGHFPWLWSKSGAMDIAFEKYAEAPHAFVVGNK